MALLTIRGNEQIKPLDVLTGDQATSRGPYDTVQLLTIYST